MLVPRMPSMLADQRGIALPMALLALLILTGLTLAFVGLAPTEPGIANNQIRTNQTLAIVKATVSAWNGRFTPPGAVTAVGEVQFGGHSSADGTTSTCGPKYGTFSLGSATFGGSSHAAGNPTAYAQNQPMSAFAAL